MPRPFVGSRGIRSRGSSAPVSAIPTWRMFDYPKTSATINSGTGVLTESWRPLGGYNPLCTVDPREVRYVRHGPRCLGLTRATTGVVGMGQSFGIISLHCVEPGSSPTDESLDPSRHAIDAAPGVSEIPQSICEWIVQLRHRRPSASCLRTTRPSRRRQKVSSYTITPRGHHQTGAAVAAGTNHPSRRASSSSLTWNFGFDGESSASARSLHTAMTGLFESRRHLLRERPSRPTTPKTGIPPVPEAVADAFSFRVGGANARSFAVSG